ncbi:MAG: hypothetical protein AAGC53_15970 [Actinomycetota bacterium]
MLDALVDHECAFVVVGSTARRLCGDDVDPDDLDIVVDPGQPHRSSLIAALSSVGATIERRSGRRPIEACVALPWEWGWHVDTDGGPVDVITRFIDGSDIAFHCAAAMSVALDDRRVVLSHPTRHEP